MPFGLRGPAHPKGTTANEPAYPCVRPAAYVILNRAPRPIITDDVDTLLGTLDSTAPLPNTAVATEAWLHRVDVPNDQLNGF
ncbi:type VI immunity family protein [Burkholderia dolosa]|uniref:type VI immunity family protein n=1 Tax=Burkholderia dolosa TaxID=152500 RepID=UPI003D15FBFA